MVQYIESRHAVGFFSFSSETLSGRFKKKCAVHFIKTLLYACVQLFSVSFFVFFLNANDSGNT